MSDHDVIPPSPQHRDEEILQHVLREVHAGRSLDAVMQDPYVVERQEAGSHEKVLDHPEVAEALGDEVITQMRQMLAAATGSAASGSDGGADAPDAGMDDELQAEMRKIDPTP